MRGRRRATGVSVYGRRYLVISAIIAQRLSASAYHFGARHARGGVENCRMIAGHLRHPASRRTLEAAQPQYYHAIRDQPGIGFSANLQS